jgi:hypothetical protein
MVSREPLRIPFNTSRCEPFNNLQIFKIIEFFAPSIFQDGGRLFSSHNQNRLHLNYII